jgi:hypothetical protein
MIQRNTVLKRRNYKRCLASSMFLRVTHFIVHLTIRANGINLVTCLV